MQRKITAGRMIAHLETLMRLETTKILSSFFEDKNKSISEFEEWLYTNPQLENELGDDIYTDLISLDFNDNSIRTYVKELVDPILDYAQLHRKEILETLGGLINKSSKPLEGIKDLFNWAEKGYMFLATNETIANLGEQGKSIVHSIDNDMDKETQWNKLLMNDVNFIDEMILIKEKIERNSIIFTGKKESGNLFGDQFNYTEK